MFFLVFLIALKLFNWIYIYRCGWRQQLPDRDVDWDDDLLNWDEIDFTSADLHNAGLTLKLRLDQQTTFFCRARPLPTDDEHMWFYLKILMLFLE